MSELRLFTNKTAIQDYIKKISGETCTDYMFKKYIEFGMPVRYQDNRWLAYADNIDEFFKHYTRVQMKQVPEESEDNPEEMG